MKLKLTRRRILIAAMAVVGILFVWWAIVPEHDPQYVGDWHTRDGYGLMSFQSDGSGASATRSDSRPEWRRRKFRWRSEPGRLIVSYSGRALRFPPIIHKLYKRLTGKSLESERV